MISKSFFKNLPQFESYYEKIQDLYSRGLTTGQNQSESYLHYTQLTLARTKRGLKTLNPSKELISAANRSKRKNWLVITEAWCGDAGNILPLIVNLSKQIEDVDLRIALRDENPEIMNLFLTNGGRSIPIFVAMDDEMDYHSHWGPRPKPAQEMAIDHKKNPTKPYEEYQIELQKWYLQDKGKTLDRELQVYFTF